MVDRRAQRFGATYKPEPMPQSGDARMIAQWCQREFERIGDTLSEGRSRGLRLDVLTVLPDRPLAGFIYSFAANVVAPGSQAGVYEFREGLGWTKL